ncbi:MAG: esterase, partial [Stenotrophomonas maltophilia]|nr:esterase [Stenotrophomonas maltophilia]
MALRTPLAGLLLALAVGHAAAADLPWSLPADASPAQVDAALQALGKGVLKSPSLTDVQRGHALVAAGQTAEARRSIQQARASLASEGDTAAVQRWVPMLLLVTAGEQDAAEYARAFHATFAALDDVAAVQAGAALSVEPAPVRAQLEQAVAAQ